MSGVITKVAAASAVVGFVAVVVDLRRVYVYIKEPKNIPSANQLGLPATFSKLQNVRDVATGPGIIGINGRRLRHGLLYRSAKLAGLPAGDLELLRQMGICFVADFRAPDEASSEPDIFADGHDVQYRSYPAIDGDPRKSLTEWMSDRNFSADKAATAMSTVYKSFIDNHAPKFRAFLAALAEPGNLPALVHCTAGKDRTGWAVALLLLILGVNEEAVMQDYLLSNALWYREARKHMVTIRLATCGRRPLDAFEPLLYLHPEYLSANIRAAAASHGTIESYFTSADGLGLEPAVIERLRDLFLEELPSKL